VIPKSTHRAHLKQSDGRCDTVTVLNMAAKQLERHPRAYADMNACALEDGDANLHWPRNPVLNHYDHIAVGTDAHGKEKRRPMTKSERHRPVVEWKTEEFLRWRRGPSGGPRPATVAMRQKQAADRDVIICWELKSREYRIPSNAARFVAAVEASGHTAYYMTLVTMGFWGQKLQAFKNAGGETALLAHGVRKTPDIAARLERFAPSIDRIWGSFR
jgi:hypothetical protein